MCVYGKPIQPSFTLETSAFFRFIRCVLYITKKDETKEIKLKVSVPTLPMIIG